MLEQSENMWDGHLCSIKVMQHQVKLGKKDNRPIHSLLYCPGPKAREMENQEKYRMLAMDGIEPAQTGCASPIVFVPKNNGTFCICFNYHKWNAL